MRDKIEKIQSYSLGDIIDDSIHNNINYHRDYSVYNEEITAARKGQIFVPKDNDFDEECRRDEEIKRLQEKRRLAEERREKKRIERRQKEAEQFKKEALEYAQRIKEIENSYQELEELISHKQKQAKMEADYQAYVRKREFELMNERYLQEKIMTHSNGQYIITHAGKKRIA